jgi:hypothetical protein
MDDLQPPHSAEKGSRTAPDELRSYRSDRHVPFAIGGALGFGLIFYAGELVEGLLLLLVTLAAWFISEAFRKWQRQRVRKRIKAARGV